MATGSRGASRSQIVDFERRDPHTETTSSGIRRAQWDDGPMLHITEHLAWGKLRSGVCVVLHDNRAPSDDAWNACIRHISVWAGEPRACAIIFTDGGAPTSTQRKLLSAVFSHSPPTAVVSDALVVRFVVSAFALASPKIATFTPADMPKVFPHLEVGNVAARASMSELVMEGARLGGRFRTVQLAIDAERRLRPFS